MIDFAIGRAKRKPLLYGGALVALLNIVAVVLGAPLVVTDAVGVVVIVAVVVGVFIGDKKS